MWPVAMVGALRYESPICDKNSVSMEGIRGVLHLKLITIHKSPSSSAPIKGRSQCYAPLHCDEYEHLRTWHIYNASKTLYMYRDQNCVVDFFFLIEKHSLPNNMETQHSQMYS